jgi:hypothetical protein
MQMKRLKLIIGMLVACSGLLLACTKPTTTEISRITNPSETIDAVIGELNTDATVATPTEIYLIPKGMNIRGEAIFRADKVEELSLLWRDTNTLIIKAKIARSFLKLSSYQIDLPTGVSKTVVIEYEVDTLL